MARKEDIEYIDRLWKEVFAKYYGKQQRLTELAKKLPKPGDADFAQRYTESEEYKEHTDIASEITMLSGMLLELSRIKREMEKGKK